ncbi:MAG: substrate-binding domain-containing protein [Rhizobiaceae bacterium]
MQKPKVNLKNLSEHLGLSQTTVSRALNGFPEVNEKTRQRVIETARTLNYRPNPSASSLATGRTGQIGHVIPLSQHMMINPHFADFMAGAGETYSAAGYDALLRVVAEDEEEDVYCDFANRNRVDGVVVHGPMVEDNRIGLLQSLGVPFVVHGRSENAPGDYSWLDVNNIRAFERAVDFLFDLGHRRIALVNGIETMNFAHRRRAGYQRGLRKYGLESDSTLMVSADMVEPYGYSATVRFLKLREPPTAIIYSSILPALGGRRAISDAGLRIGDDISVIAFDDQLSFLQPVDDIGVPVLTSLRSSIRAAGKRVAEMLIEQIAEQDRPPEQELWEADFVLGKSTKPARNRQAA